MTRARRGQPSPFSDSALCEGVATISPASRTSAPSVDSPVPPSGDTARDLAARRFQVTRCRALAGGMQIALGLAVNPLTEAPSCP